VKSSFSLETVPEISSFKSNWKQQKLWRFQPKEGRKRRITLLQLPWYVKAFTINALNFHTNGNGSTPFLF